MPTTRLDQPTILLIEQERSDCGSLSPVFQEEGFAVIPIGDLGEAARHASVHEPDLIVVDLPRATVRCVLNRLRSDSGTRGRPIIVIHRSESVDLEVVLEHVWRVVNTRVLGAVAPCGQRSG